MVLDVAISTPFHVTNLTASLILCCRALSQIFHWKITTDMWFQRWYWWLWQKNTSLLSLVYNFSFHIWLCYLLNASFLFAGWLQLYRLLLKWPQSVLFKYAIVQNAYYESWCTWAMAGWTGDCCVSYFRHSPIQHSCMHLLVSLPWTYTVCLLFRHDLDNILLENLGDERTLKAVFELESLILTGKC